jgi:hypothetical protein
MEDKTMYNKYVNAESDEYFTNYKYGRNKVSYSKFKEIYGMKSKINNINNTSINYKTTPKEQTIETQPKQYFPVHGITIND